MQLGTGGCHRAPGGISTAHGRLQEPAADRDSSGLAAVRPLHGTGGVKYLLALLLASCVVGDDVDDPVDNTDGDDPSFAPDVAGTPAKLDIGFNDGHADQFDYYADFFAAPGAIHPGPRMCHGYFAWDVANQAPHAGDPATQSTRAYLDAWLAKAQGQCDDALISFQAYAHRAAPSSAQFATAFEKFAAANWAAETGFTGTISVTAWNEPNNPADAGNGLGVIIEPELAAKYYLSAEQSCKVHGCKVAAGDFASNGTMWNDFEFNCQNDTVPTAELCKVRSSVSTGGASYLDRYKNEIANHAKDYGLGAGFRPRYFAYHGWHDTNEYLDNGAHCGTYGTCAIRRILKSLGGSWSGALLWDTEDGVGQTAALTDPAQACGAAFLLRVATLSSRLTRLYITRLHGGDGSLLTGTAPRPALGVLARRETSYPGGSCD